MKRMYKVGLLVLGVVSSVGFANTALARRGADDPAGHVRQEDRREDRRADRREDRRADRREDRRMDHLTIAGSTVRVDRREDRRADRRADRREDRRADRREDRRNP